MQLKNNENRNFQFYFYKKVSGRDVLDFVHLPGNATVELDDEIFKAMCASRTEVSIIEEVSVPLNADNIGADMKSGKEILMVKEYNDTGRKKSVNLVKEAIKAGSLTVIERVKVGMEDIDKVLTAHKVNIKDMSEDAKLALYDKLA